MIVLNYIMIGLVQVSKFSLSGVLANITNYLIYLLAFEYYNVPIKPSTIIGYFCGVIISYHFNRTWVFGKKYNFSYFILIKFLLAYFFGGYLMKELVFYFNNFLSYNSSLSWLLSAIPVAILNFLLVKYWVFYSENARGVKLGGWIGKFQFLQVFASQFISSINPAVIHNLEKYYAIKKSLYLSLIEDIDGDYIEFGVFEGSSFAHAIRTSKSIMKYLGLKKKINFYGFDSFDGFGELREMDSHPFYIDEQFKTSYKNVFRRVSRVSKSVKFKLIKGFFDDTLRCHPKKYGISKSRIIFVDTDTYSSSYCALAFCKDTIIPGTILILDDYFSYKGSSSKGVAGAFKQFIAENDLIFREIFSYGMGGKVYICDKN